MFLLPCITRRLKEQEGIVRRRRSKEAD